MYSSSGTYVKTLHRGLYLSIILTRAISISWHSPFDIIWEDTPSNSKAIKVGEEYYICYNIIYIFNENSLLHLLLGKGIHRQTWGRMISEFKLLFS